MFPGVLPGVLSDCAGLCDPAGVPEHEEVYKYSMAEIDSKNLG